jgi:hypothetical protein
LHNCTTIWCVSSQTIHRFDSLRVLGRWTGRGYRAGVYPRICRTFAASPAEPGKLPLWFSYRGVSSARPLTPCLGIPRKPPRHSEMISRCRPGVRCLAGGQVVAFSCRMVSVPLMRSKPRASAPSDSAVASERLAGDEAEFRVGFCKIASGEQSEPPTASSSRDICTTDNLRLEPSECPARPDLLAMARNDFYPADPSSSTTRARGSPL